MQQLRDHHSPATVLRALRFLSIRLKSRPESVELEPQVAVARASLVSAEEAWAQAVEERVATSSEVQYADACLDQSVADLAGEVLALVKGNRTDPRYKKLFTVPPSTVMRAMATESQERYVQNIICRVLDDADYVTLKAHGETIKANLEALQAAMVKRHEQYLPEAKASADRRIAADNARRVYNQMAAQLMLRFGHERALIDSFFYDLTRKPIEEDTEHVATDARAGT